MKLLILLLTVGFGVTLGATTSNVGVQSSALYGALQSVAAPELPAAAAEIVRATEKAKQTEVAVSVLSVIDELRPSALVAAIGAMARVAPEAASSLAVEGAILQRNQSRAAARAAAAAAPDYADEIVGAVCAKFPSLFSEIPVEVARVAPNSDVAILVALEEAIPSLKPFLQRARSLVSAGGVSTAPVALVISETIVQMGAGSSLVALAGTVGGDGDGGGHRKKKTVKGTKKKSKKAKSKKSKKKSKSKKTKKKTKSKDYSKP